MKSRRHQPRLSPVLLWLMLALLGGCASIPPGSAFPKMPSSALAHPSETRLGRDFDVAAVAKGGHSAFRIISVGADGFLTRMEMINAAEKTLDLQYFIFRGDETGRLLTEAVLHAADRGVRVRVLIDDGDINDGDEQLTKLTAHPSIELRIFNPFAYRGHIKLLRAIEFVFNHERLDYRMHNKLLVLDNAIALIGGRNIGDEYFQIDPGSQVADDDVFAAGPIVQTLSATFDEYWNSTLSIPATALGDRTTSSVSLNEHREILKERRQVLKAEGVDYLQRVATGEPFNGMISGRLPLIWAHAQVVCDSPEKKKVQDGAVSGRLMQHPVDDAIRAVQSELLMVTPYLIPGDEGMKLIRDLNMRKIRIRMLTNSLESSTGSAAQSGYSGFRRPLLKSGVELYELRSMLGNTRGSGQTAAISSHGNYSLHAKLYVFDRRQLFIGSMNFDQRSMHLNTEVGLIIDSPVLAEQVATRFDAMVQPVNAYRLALVPIGSGSATNLVWQTEEDSKTVEYLREPAHSEWQRMKVTLFSLLPLIDSEL